MRTLPCVYVALQRLTAPPGTEGLPHLGGLLKYALPLDPNLCMGFQELVEKLRA